jgi:uncharacterized membrane protein
MLAAARPEGPRVSPTIAIALLWAAFAGSHLGLSSLPVRSRLVARLGEPPFLGLYSLVAFVFFVPLLWVYFANKHAGPLLWGRPGGTLLLWLLQLGMGVAFVLLVSSLVQPNPSLVGSKGGEARGVFLLARHPLFMGIALWAALHLVVNGAASDVAFFGGMLAFSIVGSWHQDRRKLATDVPGYREFAAATPFLPFTGRETLRGLRELPPVGVALGLGLTVVLRVFHGTLFGP